MRTFRWFILLALLVAPFRPGSAADATTIVVGVEDLSYFPAYAVVDGEYVGAAREILDAFAKASGYRIVYRPMPIKRLYPELLSGGVDLKFPDSPHWGVDVKKDARVSYSAPVIDYVDGTMVPPGSVGQGGGAVKVLGTVSGFTPYAWADELRSKRVQLRENPRLDLLLKQVVLKRLDAAYVNVAVANHQLDTVMAMPGALALDSGLPLTRDSYLVSSASRPDLVEKFDRWLAANRELVASIKRTLNAEKGVH
ncbi:MAG: substrate-binding periplasmic protein [Solirubrobacterales bacterium]